MRKSREIEKMTAAPTYKNGNFTKSDHCFQVLKKSLHIAASGIHISNSSSIFMQTMVVHREKRQIISDILEVIPHGKSSAARTRIYVKKSIPALSHESETRKSVAILYDERMMNHRPDYYCEDGDDRMIKHEVPPESAVELPTRISSIMEKLYADKLMDRATLVEVDFASLDHFEAVHDADYGDFIHCLPPNQADLEKCHGYYSTDMFCSEGTRDAVFLAAGATIKAAELVHTGLYEKAFAVIRPPGHHVGKGEAEGFCYSNNLAIAAQNLISNHDVKKIAAVDWDVHHGNGTQELFYSSDQVLFFSTFNNSLSYPKTMKQGVEDIGKGKGAGYNVNVPLRDNFGDSDMLYVWNELLLPLLEEFQADIILISCGYDAAKGDLGRAKVSPRCYATLLDKLVKSGNGKVVLILEGGYNLPILSNCAAQCVRVLTGDSTACLKEDKPTPLPPRGTRDTVQDLKRLLSRKWNVFKA